MGGKGEVEEVKKLKIFWTGKINIPNLKKREEEIWKGEKGWREEGMEGRRDSGER